MGYEPLTVSVESVSSKKKFPFNLFIFVFGPFEHFLPPSITERSLELNTNES